MLSTPSVYEDFRQTLANFGYGLSENDYRLARFRTDLCFDAQSIEDLKSALTAATAKFRRTKSGVLPSKQLTACLLSCFVGFHRDLPLSQCYLCAPLEQACSRALTSP